MTTGPFILFLLSFIFSRADSSCPTTDGKTCVFPFIYDGKTYDGCTTVDNGGTPWCATSVDSFNEVFDYGNCGSSCEILATVSTKGCPTTTGARCTFPFTMDGVTYETCTKLDSGSTNWCAIRVDSNNEIISYGICDSSCPVETTLSPTQCATQIGKACIFPFKYGGRTYPACATTDDTNAWCATTVNQNQEVTSYGYCNNVCEVSGPVTGTTGTFGPGCSTTDGNTCKLPFTYAGKTYEGCTNVDYGNTMWCATSFDSFGDIAGYGECSSSCPLATTVTKRGCPTTSGGRCLFPFVYNGVTYDTCTSADFGSIYWCATTVNSDDTVGSYGTCDATCPMEITLSPTVCATVSGMPCVFPFTYGRITYSSCTTADNEGKPWCAKKIVNNVIVDFDNCNSVCDVDVTVTPTTTTTTTTTTKRAKSTLVPKGSNFGRVLRS